MLQNTIEQLSSILDYKDSRELAQRCEAKIAEIQAKIEEERIICERIEEKQRIAEEKERIEKERQAEIKRIKAKKRAKRNNKIALAVGLITVITIACIILYKTSPGRFTQQIGRGFNFI